LPDTAIHSILDYARHFSQRFIGQFYTFDSPFESEAVIIADAINKLCIAAQLRLGSRPTRAIVVIPQIPGLKQPLLNLAFRKAGVELLTTNRHIGDITEISAAYAAAGNGLCTDFTSPFDCQDEEADFPCAQVLAISFSQSSLRVVKTFMQSAVRFHSYLPSIDLCSLVSSIAAWKMPAKHAGTWAWILCSRMKAKRQNSGHKSSQRSYPSAAMRALEESPISSCSEMRHRIKTSKML